MEIRVGRERGKPCDLQVKNRFFRNGKLSNLVDSVHWTLTHSDIASVGNA